MHVNYQNNILNTFSCAIGTHVYVLNGTDPEGDEVQYELDFEKGSTEYFKVDPKSGYVTLIEELDREVSTKQRRLRVCVTAM